jgi:hypothetical protein
MALSARTLAERKAGRDAIQLAVAEQMLAVGMKELARRFPSVLLRRHLNWDKGSPEAAWMVEIRVQCSDGSFQNLTDSFAGFPNNDLIAQLALVV